MGTSHLFSILAHINPFLFRIPEFQTDSIYMLSFKPFPPKLDVTKSGHMNASSGLLMRRRAASDCMFLSHYYTF